MAPTVHRGLTVGGGRAADPSGAGSASGRSGAEPVVDGYPGERPWAFAGGTIKRVVIDVSGEAFEDLAMEARAAFARQ